VKRVGPIRMSTQHPTILDCLRELQTRIQQYPVPKYVTEAQVCQTASSVVASTKRPVDEGAVSRNANDVLMLRVKLKSLEERTVIANKSVLDAEKERDKLHKEPDLIEVYLEGKRVYRSATAGEKVIRPPAPSDVSVCKARASCHAFLFCF
jgi:hypothetical protein